MYSIIVVPGSCSDPGEQIRLAPGETLRFGRSPAPPPATASPPASASAHGRHLTITHEGVSRSAGEITATGAYWTLSNLSRVQTYVVENPEGAGEHIKVSPGRVDAPVPFEFSRVVLPAAGELLTLDVWAPRHDYLDGGALGAQGADGAVPDGMTTTAAFPLDHGKRYFLVLVALCAPRLGADPLAPLPTVDEVVARLRPAWPSVSRTAVQWNIDYLAVKLRLRPDPKETATDGRRFNGKKETLVSLALRFDLVREEDLALLKATS